MKPVLPSPARFLRTLPATRSNMLVIGAAYSIFAVSLLLQSARWGLTPAYHDLLGILPQQSWGVGFAVISALLLTAVALYGRRWLSVLALSAGIAITTFWCTGFIVRWLTSPNTTPETWVSWAVFDYLLLRALTLLHREASAPGGDTRG